MEENVIQINGVRMINGHKNVKNVMYVKKNTFGILLHVMVKMVKRKISLFYLHFY